ncbi:MULTISPECIES: hypothetical protein [Clostridia]|jgi:hypothetical protein|uniref:hypothetical protein n=1 Tax=Clostridia TaxID=186801 RepID=UPI000E545BFB|nr:MULTISPECIES: hypothetical protein [Clostridia]RHV66017.1 hypothetical protein DXB15_13700 [Roseburia sp. OM02-15]
MGMKIRQIGVLSVKIFTQDDVLAQNRLLSKSDREMDTRAVAAVKSAIYKAKICKKPIAKYDPVLKTVYIEYADGRRCYVE